MTTTHAQNYHNYLQLLVMFTISKGFADTWWNPLGEAIGGGCTVCNNCSTNGAGCSCTS